MYAEVAKSGQRRRTQVPNLSVEFWKTMIWEILSISWFVGSNQISRVR